MAIPKDRSAVTRQIHDVDEIAKGLAALPEPGLRKIDAMIVNPVASPDDRDPRHPAYMTITSSGRVHVYPTEDKPPQSYLDKSLSHEVGHVVAQEHLGHVLLLQTPAWNAVRQAMDSDALSVSQYTDVNESEDFSESFSLYQAVIGTNREADARALFPARFSFFDRLALRR